jgi:hypothetical protein
VTDEPDDLARILGYVDAVDPRTGVVELGPELLCVPFWTPEFCHAVVRAAGLIGFAPDPDDPVPGREVSLAAISPQLFRGVEEDLGRRIWPQLQTVWPLIDFHGVRDAFVIRYAKGEQEELRQHLDVAQVSATVRLDDDHDGAELRFPRQGVDTATLPVGSLLAWPSMVTHPHETSPLRRGERHGLTIWFDLPLSGMT